MKAVAICSGVGLAGYKYISLRHIRNKHLHGISYVRWPSQSSYLSMRHIRKRLFHGISYVRWPSRSSYLSMRHIRNKHFHGISYVRRAADRVCSSMRHIRNRLLHGFSYVRMTFQPYCKNTIRKSLTIRHHIGIVHPGQQVIRDSSFSNCLPYVRHRLAVS